MTSLIESLAHEDGDSQRTSRRVNALALERAEARFGSFLRAAKDGDEFTARFELIRDDVVSVVKEAAADAGAPLSDENADFFGRIVFAEALRSNLIANETSKEAALNWYSPAMKKNASNQSYGSIVVEARKPKMCPYHSEVVDISLAQGEPQAGFNAMAQHAWGPKHCQGDGYEGDRCKFKPQMTTQSFWDDRAEKAEQKREERRLQQEQEAQQAELAPVTELTDLPADDPVDNPSATLDEGYEGESVTDEPVADAPVEEVPMAMAASVNAPLGVGSREAEYKYVQKRGDEWVILQKGTGKVLSHHESKEDAEAAFRAMMANKHGQALHTAEALKTVNVKGTEGPVPTINKRQWKPLDDIDTEMDGSPHPTRRKDIIEPIEVSNGGNRHNPSALKEVGEDVTERQDVTQKSDFRRKNDSWGGPSQANPVTK